MSFLKLAEERFSCRKFDGRPVEREKIDYILKCALAAPTAVNKQPQKILVINDTNLLEELKSVTKYTFSAPLCFAVCTNDSKAYKRGYDGKSSAEIDAAIAATHMMLAAQDIGLGTTWVMAFDPTKARDCLNIPDELEIVALMPTGYPAGDAKASHLHYESVGMDEMASTNEF